MSNTLYNTFPTVSNGKIGGEQIQTVNARDLHEFLENGEMFATWIKDKIETYNFVENQDFLSFLENTKKPKGDCLSRGSSNLRNLSCGLLTG